MATPPTLAIDERYEYRGELGEGGLGRVLLVVERESGREFAAKWVLPNAFALLRSEADVLRGLRHDKLVRVRELLRLEKALPPPWSMPKGAGLLIEERAVAVM